MSIISSTIPNLVNGVSQQPFALRLASQAEAQTNGYSTVVEGLRKRPGTRHIKRLNRDILVNHLYFHTINRDANERYLVSIDSNQVRVYDLEGNERTVYAPAGFGYLNGSYPKKDIRCVTVADYTFILNTQRVTAADPTSHEPHQFPHAAIVWIKQGAYGATYRVFVGGHEVNYTVPDGSDKAHTGFVRTDHIARALADQMGGGIFDQYYVARYNSQIYIRRWDNQPFSIRTQDSLGENGSEVFYRSVQRFASLPARAVNGFRVEVTGDQSSSFDNYFVQFQTNDGSLAGPGVWKEAAKGGELTQLQPSTMPHALVRNSDGTFTFHPLAWEKRKCGDLESNPMPSFIGRKITDVFFHRNRLGFVSDENVVMSRTGDYFNFFRTTATDVVDDDPIDVGVSHTKVSLIRHAVPFAETLLLFSDQTQFQLAKTDVLTPATVAINQTTEYECSLQAKPVGVGRHVYFTVNRGQFTGMKEYYMDAATEVLDADEITGHVPRYIPGDVYKIASSGTEDCLAVLSHQAQNKAFIYKFFWAENEKMQASWSEWVFPEGDTILNADFIESTLYLVIKRTDGTHLERICLEPGLTEYNWNIHVHLDRMVAHDKMFAITFNELDPNLQDDNVSELVLPYRVPDHLLDHVEIITAPGGQMAPGKRFRDLQVASDGDHTTVFIKGDWRFQPFYIGLRYEFRYRFSTLAVREDAQGGGQNVVGEGRLQVRRMSLLYDKTGYFRVETKPFNRDRYTYTFSGKVVGSANNILGLSPIERGRFRFPLMARNDQIDIDLVNDSPLPSHFLSAEWEGFFILRSKRI